MKLVILCIGKVKDRAFLSLETEYLKRAKELSVIELHVPGVQDENRIHKEGSALLEASKRYDFVVCLDETGKQLSSKKFSNLLGSWGLHGKSSIAFLIGGAFGHSEEVRKQSDFVWALSDLTFPFQIARLLVVEQLYRALCMLRGHPYHKE